MSGSGTHTLGLAFGGQDTTQVAVTEDWNGASWVEVADLSTARANTGGAGSYTAGLAFGGATTVNLAATEEWSGSSNTVKVLTD